MMAKVTHIWTGSNNKKTPLELMDDEYLCNAYRRCKETVFEPKGKGYDMTRNFHQAMPRDTAEKWIPLFEAEAKRRGLRLPKVDRHTYYQDLRQRMERKKSKWDSNKNFDEKFT